MEQQAPQEPLLPPAQPSWTFWQLMFKKSHNVSRVSESLDYEPIQNELYFNRIKQRKAKRHVYGYSGLTLAKTIVVVMTGILTGVSAIIIVEGSASLLRWRNEKMQALIYLESDGVHGLWQAFLFIIAFSFALVTIGGCMVTFWAPGAAGAGVSLVMAYLNGNHIPHLLRLRTLVTKVIGSLLAVASGLAVGPEGPLIHIGACIASNIANADCGVVAQLFCPFMGCNNQEDRGADDDEGSISDEPENESLCAVWEDLHEDSEHREFISAGVAAGLSAAFGAPIGGVLFSMEEACSFWSRKVAWRCFLAAILAAFTMSQLTSHGDTPIKFNNVRTLDKWEQLRQIPFMVIVSLIGGLLGAVFNRMRVFLWPIRASRSRKLLRILELLAITAVCLCVAFFTSAYFGTCREIPASWRGGETASRPTGWARWSPAGLNPFSSLLSLGGGAPAQSSPFESVRFGCGENEHNDLATMFLSVPDDLLTRLFSEGASDTSPVPSKAGFSSGSLVVFSVTYLLLMSLCAGVCIPAGLFMPSILLGAAVGLTSGRLINVWTPPDWEIQPGLYALICATAVLAGVFRSAISVVVIVVEGTRGIGFLFGVIIAVVVANWIADMVHKDGVYESELERDGNVHFLRHEPPNALSTLTAEQIMVREPVCFTPIAPVDQVLKILTRTTHHGFPVVDKLRDALSDDQDGVGQLEGIILRSQLLVMLRERAFCDVQGNSLNTALTRRSQYKIEREMRLFYRNCYTHHRHMATKDNDMISLLAALSAPDQRDAAEDAPDSASASSATSNGVAASAVPELEPAIVAGSRSVDEMNELQDILQDVGAGSLLYLDLRLYMNTAPLTVRKEMSAARVHRTFVTLGMRHMCVTNNQNRIVGIITRKDLDAAAGHGAWRRAALHDDAWSRTHESAFSSTFAGDGPSCCWPWLRQRKAPPAVMSQDITGFSGVLRKNGRSLSTVPEEHEAAAALDGRSPGSNVAAPANGAADKP